MLAETGADGRVLILVGVITLLAGLAAILLARRSKHAGLLASGLVLAIVTATALITPTVASASAECDPSTVSMPSPTASAPVTPDAPTEAPVPTDPPAPVTPVCPAAGELTSLPAGQFIAWAPITVEDPTDVPGDSPWEWAKVYEGGISGYTWYVTSDSGTRSEDCGGMPLTNGECTPYPAEVHFNNVVWQPIDETTTEWMVWGSGYSDGCRGSSGVA